MIGSAVPVGQGETPASLEIVPAAAYRGHMTGPGEPLRPPGPAELAGDLPALPDDLARVEAALRESVQTPDPFLAEVATHLIGAGGKRLRPTLTLCSAYASNRGGAGPATDAALTGSVACELVHLGSLYHDDVIDEAETRRGVPSVNARWSNIVAILAGDFLLARASSLAASLGADVASLLAATIGELCRGQVLELQHLFDVDRSEEDYSSAIEGKTAALFATSCRIGGMVSAVGDATLDALTRFGRHLGMCFQIVDDVLDLSSTDDALGKHAGQDLLEGIYTLPVIYAVRESKELRELLGGPLDPAQLESARALALGPLAAGSTAVDLALGVARDHAVKASDALDGADGLGGDVCRTLGRLVDGLVLRER
jgi:geranylgeranyl pyrophosphate synthase